MRERRTRVSVRELKDRLSEYLRKAAAGEEIVVFSRNRPVARILAPLAPGVAEAPEEAAIRRLDAQPWIRPPLEAARSLPDYRDRTLPGEKPLSEIVAEDRG